MENDTPDKCRPEGERFGQKELQAIMATDDRQKREQPTEPTVRLGGTHLVVAFCSVLETLVENSKELAEQCSIIDQLKSELKQAQDRAQYCENIADGAKKDSDRLDILHDFAKKHGRVLIICDTRGFGIADDSARMMQPPIGLNDYRQHLREAIDAIGIEPEQKETQQ